MNFLNAHVFGVAFVMKEDVAFYPLFVGLFGAVGVVFETDGVGDLVEQFFACCWGLPALFGKFRGDGYVLGDVWHIDL